MHAARPLDRRGDCLLRARARRLHAHLSTAEWPRLRCLSARRRMRSPFSAWAGDEKRRVSEKSSYILLKVVLCGTQHRTRVPRMIRSVAEVAARRDLGGRATVA